MDIIIDKMGFEIPLSKYEGKDFVIWGREEKITQGDVLNGKNPSPMTKFLPPSQHADSGLVKMKGPLPA